MSTDELTAPGRSRGLVSVLSRRYLLRLIVRKEVRVRYRGSILGIAWSYVKPAVQFGVYYLALGVFLQLNRGIEDFAVYLFSGIVAVNFFGEGFGNATRSIVVNAPLVRKIYLPRELFPVASIRVAIVHFIPQLVVLLVGSLIAGWRPTLLSLVAGVLGFAIVGLLSLGLGMFFGAVNVLYRDAENFVDLIVMVATWTSPVLYTWRQVADTTPDWFLTLYLLNPLTSAVELFHYAFWYPATSGEMEPLPNLWMWGAIGVLLSLGAVAMGQAVFRRLEGNFAQEL